MWDYYLRIGTSISNEVYGCTTCVACCWGWERRKFNPIPFQCASNTDILQLHKIHFFLYYSYKWTLHNALPRKNKDGKVNLPFVSRFCWLRSMHVPAIWNIAYSKGEFMCIFGACSSRKTRYFIYIFSRFNLRIFLSTMLQKNLWFTWLKFIKRNTFYSHEHIFPFFFFF